MTTQPSAYGPIPGPPINPPNVVDILEALTEDEIRRRCVLYPELVMRFDELLAIAECDANTPDNGPAILKAQALSRKIGLPTNF